MVKVVGMKGSLEKLRKNRRRQLPGMKGHEFCLVNFQFPRLRILLCSQERRRPWEYLQFRVGVLGKYGSKRDRDNLSTFGKECQEVLNINCEYSRKDKKLRKNLGTGNNSIANIYILLTDRTVPDAKKEAVCTGDGFFPRIWESVS